MGQSDEPGQEPIDETKLTKLFREMVSQGETMSTSSAQNIVRAVHSSSAWDVAWNVVEDEVLGMTMEMAVSLQDSLCLGPQIQVTDIEEHCEGH